MYKFKKDGDQYNLYKDNAPLTTPAGSPVATMYQPVAKRLVKDLEKYGEDPSNPISLVAFQYATIDFFMEMPREELEHSVAIGLEKDADWTFNCPTASPEPMMQWWGTFGKYSTQSENGKEWIPTLTLMQLCSVCIIGRALESVNIPFIVATILEKKHLAGFAKEINKYYPYVSVAELKKYFDNFLFYFNADGGSSNR
ncbi:hypothetical protein ACFL43_01800 [Thermodesulfobacteriota bacterium]